jgi:hypothetical protein
MILSQIKITSLNNGEIIPQLVLQSVGPSYFYQNLVNVISNGIYPKSPEREADPLKLKFVNISN